MQIKITTSAFFVICILIGSCGVTKPYVDTRREAGKNKPVGESTPSNVVICYNSMLSTSDEIKKLARDECEKTGRKPVFEKQKSFSCTVLLPMRAYFKCENKTREDIAKDKDKENNKTIDERLRQIRSTNTPIQIKNNEENTKEKNKDSTDNDKTPEQVPGYEMTIIENGIDD